MAMLQTILVPVLVAASVAEHAVPTLAMVSAQGRIATPSL